MTFTLDTPHLLQFLVISRPSFQFIADPLQTYRHPHNIHISSSPAIHPSLKSLLNSLPVNHIPDRTKIFGLPVLILQIICMLPRINAQQRCVFSNNRVLVGICADLDLTSLVVLDEPGPAAALDTGECGVEFGLEVRKGAVGGFNCCLFAFVSFTSFEQEFFEPQDNRAQSSRKKSIKRDISIPSAAQKAHHPHHSCSVPNSPKTEYGSHVHLHGS